MARTYQIPLQNGEHIVDDFGQFDGFHQLVFAYGTKPTAGTMSVFAKTTSSDWMPVNEAMNLSMTGDTVLVSVGNIDAYKFVISGLVGGTDLEVHVNDLAVWPGPGLPPGLFEGLRAITTQPYTEANVKNGLQFYLRASWPLLDPIAPGTTRKLWFKTGSKPVIIKLRDFQYLAEEMSITLTANPTGVSGGTALTISNYNGINPVATTAQAKKGVTTISDGSPLGATEYFFGNNAAPQRTAAAIPQGRERILPPDTEFIVAITNGGTGNARAEYFLDWYEGDPDLPRH